MVPMHHYNANYPCRDLDMRNSPAIGDCESNSCDLPAIGYCDRCGKLLCGICSHPTTPKTTDRLLCNPWCLYDPAQLRDYGY